MFLHYLWVGPLQAVAVLLILWLKLGVASLAGFSVLMLLIPLQICMGRVFAKLRLVEVSTVQLQSGPVLLSTAS